VIASGAPRIERVAWTALTHLGGVCCSVLAAVLPLLGSGTLYEAAVRASATLVASHLVVQLLKRNAKRPRPSRRVACATHVDEPDKFSFPSGHACAAMAVCAIYAAYLPLLAPALLVAATLVGWSRVRLGVHYPGDVLAGQGIALITGALVLAV
jgi:undecaprenyl-diphosphatase